jgi:hypothetical protein
MSKKKQDNNEPRAISREEQFALFTEQEIKKVESERMHKFSPEEIQVIGKIGKEAVEAAIEGPVKSEAEIREEIKNKITKTLGKIPKEQTKKEKIIAKLKQIQDEQSTEKMKREAEAIEIERERREDDKIGDAFSPEMYTIPKRK